MAYVHLLSQDGSQLLDFLLVFPQQSILGILIDAGFVPYVLGSVGIAQGAESLVVIVVRRRQAGYHERLGIASKRVLQHPSQLGVSVGHMSAPPVCQG